MANTPKLTVRFSIQKRNNHPCYTPIRWVVSYNRKRLYCTINVPQIEAKELVNINSDCTISVNNPSLDTRNTAETLNVIKGYLEDIAKEAIGLDEWDNFTSEDLKGIVGCLLFWTSDPNAVRKYLNATGLCFNWILDKNGRGQ